MRDAEAKTLTPSWLGIETFVYVDTSPYLNIRMIGHEIRLFRGKIGTGLKGRYKRDFSFNPVNEVRQGQRLSFSS